MHPDRLIPWLIRNTPRVPCLPSNPLDTGQGKRFNAHVHIVNIKEPNMSQASISVSDDDDSVLSTATRRQAQATGNIFLEGPFAPVDRETTATALQVTGSIPEELDGLYVRIGPNPLKAPQDPRKYHWFTGDGMVHGVRLSGGEALWYRNRWIGSKSVQRKLGRDPVPGKTRGIFDTVNTNVYGHAGRVWASVEAGPAPVQLDSELTSVRHGLFDSEPTVPFTAHPHRDPVSGDLHAITYDAIQHKTLNYVRVSAKGQVDKIVRIPVKHGPMVHDCAITRSQVIVLDLPVTFSWWEMIKRSPFPYSWNPKHGARVGLLPREGEASDIRWFDVDPCYVFHPCNAYDLPDGSVVLDVVVHQHMFDQSRIGPEADTHPSFERWTLPAGGQRVVREMISRRDQEFPRPDERRFAQRYRYAYTVEFSVDMAGGQSVLKHDLDTRTTTEHRFAEHLKPGEFVFVPRRADSAEDEGWLMGFVSNLNTGLGEYHVLDASDLSAPASAVVQLPAPVPLGFHGNWVGAADLGGGR
ncbi:MAG: carotenoid oxygenase [Burkholderiales bacterium]|nr:MAG: carotenoid oxygenase [Burkholderiales bacterium]